MTDEPKGGRLHLSDDAVDVIVGLVLFGVLLVVAAATADLGAAVSLLIVVAGAFGGLVLAVALVRRSLRRGLADAARWTFGFVGRWFSF